MHACVRFFSVYQLGAGTRALRPLFTGSKRAVAHVYYNVLFNTGVNWSLSATNKQENERQQFNYMVYIFEI